MVDQPTKVSLHIMVAPDDYIISMKHYSSIVNKPNQEDCSNSFRSVVVVAVASNPMHDLIVVRSKKMIKKIKIKWIKCSF